MRGSAAGRRARAGPCRPLPRKGAMRVAGAQRKAGVKGGARPGGSPPPMLARAAGHICAARHATDRAGLGHAPARALNPARFEWRRTG